MAGNTTKIYKATGPDGGDYLVVATGGQIQLASGANLTIGGTALTVTADELNALDGLTATVAELNILDGVTSTTAELNILDGVTSTAAELNKLDGAGDVVASGTQAAYVADPSVSISDISDSATGAEIATAVNALIDSAQGLASIAADTRAALRGFNILASS